MNTTTEKSPVSTQESAKVQHTPGPWFVPDVYLEGELTHGVLAGDPSDPQVVCSLGVDFMAVEDTEESNANARLIAAAPKLLVALREIMRECELRGFELTETAWRLGILAATEAEGRNA